ncbi:hypothetical protein SEPCBS119000_002060 [Sporothrix epigloea]|uniref:SAP domain-containing protein n=1 Tax=Sporothrix epigloea TaxID=1892477 RepID=A0ABP0DFS3_9PEZI
MGSTESDWSKLTVVNLRAELKQRNLPTAGRKDELIQRLIAHEEDAEKANGGLDDGKKNEQAIEDDAEMVDAPKEEEVAEVTAVAEAAAPAEQPEEPPVPASPIPLPAPVPILEVVQDEQKRKRRLLTPPPPLETDAIDRSKRLRTAGPDGSMPADVDTEMSISEDRAPTPAADLDPSTGPEAGLDDTYANDIDDSISVIPAIHPATTAIYICHLMRPLRPQTLREKMDAVATPPTSTASDSRDSSAILRTYLDPIKTHAFVVFGSISAAARARAALHGQVWPDERNRRPLWVDYVPNALVDEWIDLEEQAASGGASGGSRSSTKKWEVVYSQETDGRVVTTLLEAGTCNSKSVPGRILYEPSRDNSSFVGDFSARRSPPPFDAPRGPRSDNFHSGGRVSVNQQLASRNRFGNGVSPVPPPPPPPLGRDRPRGRDDPRGFLDDEIRLTRTLPALSYQTISLDLARRRQETIRIHTMPRPDGETRRSPSPGPGRDGQSHYTKTHNRYTFEQGDRLVDRGPEQFDGIRPPHREQERQNQRRKFGSTGGPGAGRNGNANRMGGGGDNGGRHWRNNRSNGGGRVYDDYRPDRDGPIDRNGDKRDDRRNNGRSSNRRRWNDRRDRARNSRNGRDEREGRLEGPTD